MRIRFLRDALLESEGRGRGLRYQAGDVHDFSDDQGQRWIRRGLAEEIADEPAIEAVETSQPEAPAVVPAPVAQPTPPNRSFNKRR